MKNPFRKKIVLPTKGFGLIERLPEPDDFVLGSANQALKVVLSPERDYTKYLPVAEAQARNFDSYSCVSFSADNNLEIIYKRQFGTEVNWSDRFTSSMSGTVPNQGNGFKTVADSIRKNGMVLEEDYPFGGVDDYEYVKKPAQNVIDKGQAWLLAFEVQYEWVDWGGCHAQKLYDALQFGPLKVSADATALRTGDISNAVNHAVTIYKGIEGKSFSIFDHYDAYTYDVPWKFYFGSAMQYSLLKKKFVPLVMVYNKPEIYALFGSTACHITDENTWNYGATIGIWQKTPQLITSGGFNDAYTVGKSLTLA